MIFTTPTQFIALGLLFLVGWLWGYASHNGGRKWRRRHEEATQKYAAYRNEAESDLRDAKHRIATLEAANASPERQNAGDKAAITGPKAKLPPAPPTMSSTSAPLALANTQPGSLGDKPQKGGLGVGGPDDLTRIRGIDTLLGTRLVALGVTRYDDIEKLSAVDEMALEHRLALPVGLVAREQWRDQAALLRAGKDSEHRERFGR